uniref:Uncharacterized protein n=1 Tax=viral metagenome TaxID=1070528 RepID=A0A6M3IGW9_9ZZZZ
MSERLTCGECHAERDELTGLLCYRCRSRWQEKEMNELRAEIERLKAELDLVHPRVLKLAKSGKRFIVIGEHEPYFMAAYAMIRDQEMKQGTWTEEDRVEYAAAQLSAKGSSDENL